MTSTHASFGPTVRKISSVGLNHQTKEESWSTQTKDTLPEPKIVLRDFVTKQKTSIAGMCETD